MAELQRESLRTSLESTKKEMRERSLTLLYISDLTFRSFVRSVVDQP